MRRFTHAGGADGELLAVDAGDYGLARALHAVGVGCLVAASGRIERPAANKIKTDQRDGCCAC